MKITFVIPVYNERETLRPLVEGITEHVGPHEHRILFVDDGSTDGSYEELLALKQNHPAVDVLRMRGNFGKSTALAAGFAHVDGDLVFTMDSDLQDDPKEIPRFLEKLDEGYDVVCGWKAVRHDPWQKTVPSRIYNRFVSWLFGLPIHDVNCGFKLFRCEVVRHIRLYGEMHRLIPVQAHYLNYRVAEIPVEHHRRRYGESKYGLERFWRGAVDVLTTWFLTRYRHQPGHLFGKLGIIQLGLGGIGVAGSGLSTCFVGWTPGTLVSFLVSLALVAFGALTVSLGLLAELVLYHFIRIDPTVYISQDNND